MSAIRDFIGQIESLKQQQDEHPQAPAPVPTPLQVSRRWLSACGYLSKYAERYDPSAPAIADGPAERALQQWIADLPQMLIAGGWLLLGGAVGTRKSFATCRIVDAARQVSVCKGEGYEPRGLIPGAEVMWYFAPSLVKSLLAWDGDAEDEPGYMSRLLQSRLLVIDDVDRFLELRDGDYKLGKLLGNLDSLMEYRDQPRRVTVITANRHSGQMYNVPEFRRWVDRARERGVCIDIQGRSTRGTRTA